MIRNPKNDDLGDVVAEPNDPLEQLFLYDGKELLVQKINEDYRLCQTTEKTPTYTILVREWRGDTWEFGTLYEVTIDKLLTCDKLAEFLQANLFPLIPLTSLFGARVNILKPYVRSDLALKGWRSLSQQTQWVG